MSVSQSVSGDLQVFSDLHIGGESTFDEAVVMKKHLRVAGKIFGVTESPFKGLFPSLSALREAYPAAQSRVGWYALVGTSFPAAIYRFEGRAWTDTGSVWEGEDFPLSDYMTREEVVERFAALEDQMTFLRGIREMLTPPSPTFTFEDGIISATGVDTPRADRVRSSAARVDGRFTVSVNPAYHFNIFYWDADGRFDRRDGDVWLNGSVERTYTGSVRFIFAPTAGHTISADDNFELTLTSDGSLLPQMQQAVTTLQEDMSLLAQEVESLSLQSVLSLRQRFAGRRLSVLGDSISTYSGEIPQGYDNFYGPSKLDLKDMWWRRIIDLLGMEKEVVDAWSGSRVSEGYSQDSRVSMCREERLANLGDPDVIILFGGVNDWRYGCRLGDYRGRDDGFDLSLFRHAYEYVLQQLLTRYPRARLYACTMLQDGRTTDSATFPSWKSSVGYLHEYAESIRRLSGICGVTCIDLYAQSGITYYNGQAGGGNVPVEGNTLTIDGLHPTALGMRLVAEAILRAL